MTTVKDIKGVITALPDDYWFLIKNEQGATYPVKIEVDTENKALVIKK